MTSQLYATILLLLFHSDMRFNTRGVSLYVGPVLLAELLQMCVH